MQNHKNNFIGSGEAQSCKLNEQHRSFLNKRGITDKVIDAFSIHTADVPELRLQNAIAIPVRHIDGTHSFNKYRRDPMEGPVKPKYLFERGGKVTLYGADKLVAEQSQEKSIVVITEGELDTLVCWSAGIPAVSSTAGSSSFQEEWKELLSRYEVYICFDNDEAGHKGAIKVLESLPFARVIIVPNALDVKDISDYRSRGGDIHQLIKTAFSVTDIDDAKVQYENLSAAWRMNEAKFFELYIEHHKVPTLPTNVNGAGRPTSQSEDRLEKAKSVDCRTLLPFTKIGRHQVTKCLWHDDHDPSLTYYEKNNNCYCFVCSKYADAVDITMATEGVDFKSALKTLLHETN